MASDDPAPAAPAPVATSPLHAGVAEALGAPAFAMAATFLAFGAAAREAGLSAAWTLAASLGVYGMPGQLVLLQAGPAAGGAVVPVVLGAVVVNARFLPMAVALAPMLAAAADATGPRRRRWWDLLPAVPFIAVTPWAAAMRCLPAVAPPGRLRWFLGFGLTSWLVAAAAALAGHGLAGSLDPALRVALLFANPLYFALLLSFDLNRPGPRRVILLGIAAAPLALVLPASWGLLGAGLVGGTIAHLWGAHLRGRGRRGRG